MKKNMKDPHRQRTTGDGKFALPMSRPRLSGGSSALGSVSRQSGVGSSKRPRERHGIITGTSNKRKASTTSSTTSRYNLQKNGKGEVLCSFCLLEPAALMIKGRVIAEKPLCLNHFYTTRAVRQYTDQPDRVAPIVPKSSLRSSSNDETSNKIPSQMQLQLPTVQSLFAQAFVELQRDLGEEIARVTLDMERGGSQINGSSTASTSKRGSKVKSVSKRDPLGAALIAAQRGTKIQPQTKKNVGGSSLPSRPDPLAMLSSRTSNKKRQQHASKGKPHQDRSSLSEQVREQERRKHMNDQEGGFVRTYIVKLPSRFVAQQERVKQQQQNMQDQASKFAKSSSRSTSTGQTSLDGWLVSNQTASKNTNKISPRNSTSTGKYNPYKRRKGNPQASYWSFSGQNAESGNNGEEKEGSSLPSWEEIERQANAQSGGATSACPSCKSSNVRSNDGAVIAKRNGELAKGETWGNKDRSDAVFHRVTCFDCGTTWNEEE